MFCLLNPQMVLHTVNDTVGSPSPHKPPASLWKVPKDTKLRAPADLLDLLGERLGSKMK